MRKAIVLAGLIMLVATGSAMAECPSPRENSNDDARRTLCQQERLTDETDRFGTNFQLDADRRTLDRVERRMDRFRTDQQRPLIVTPTFQPPVFNP